MNKKMNTLLPHQSGLRSLMTEARGKTYIAFETLEAASTHPDAALIFEGDDGGTIYLTTPVSKIKCSESTLRQLLLDIDSMYWKDPKGARIYFEPAPAGTGIAGGMGGGVVLDRLWLHPRIEALGIMKEVNEVIEGSLERLGSKEGKNKR